MKGSNPLSLRLAAAGLLALCCAQPADAARRARAAPPPVKPAEAVNLENKRRVSLLSFEVVMPGKDKDKDPETVVGKLEKPLPSGEKANLPLTGAKGCLFEARWKFEDVSDFGAVDLCNDAHIVLVD
jgi:hypothetical protein